MLSKPLVITSGEPAGIGPDIILSLASTQAIPVVVFGNFDLFKQRAKSLNLKLEFVQLAKNEVPKLVDFKVSRVFIEDFELAEAVTPGIINLKNSPYVLKMLDAAVTRVDRIFEQDMSGDFHALITAPLDKSAIQQAGFINFIGHTEYLAAKFNTKSVMMLSSERLAVALVTTHCSLKDVAEQVNYYTIVEVIAILIKNLILLSVKKKLTVKVAALNPHAGENGCLGDEEILYVTPALNKLREQYPEHDIIGPLSADTMFTNLNNVDVFVAMYHDQGLAPFKSLSFQSALNITLGLPILRTSVDHGVALPLAATGAAIDTSLEYVINKTANYIKNLIA